MTHRARSFAAQAIGSQTICSSGSLEQDLQLIATLRDTCSHRVQWRLDAGSQYDLASATRLCAGLEPGSVEFVLDPVGDGHASLLSPVRAAARVPLGACATVNSPADVMHLARAGDVAWVVVDPVRVGGLLRARQCAAVAEAAGLGAAVRVLDASGLALSATLQLAAATPAFSGGHECSYPQLHDDILAEPLRTVDGTLAVPMAPGLGVEVDRDKVERYQVDA